MNLTQFRSSVDSTRRSQISTPSSSAIKDVQPILDASMFTKTKSNGGKRLRLRSNCSIYTLESESAMGRLAIPGLNGSTSFVFLRFDRNTPSSWPNATAELRTIHAIRSVRLVGSITSSRHRSFIVTVSSNATGGSLRSGVAIINAESQPSFSGGKCSARGYHSASRSNASIEPIWRVLPFESFSCPSMIRRMRCSQCCHNLLWIECPRDEPPARGSTWCRDEINRITQQSMGSFVMSQ